MDPTTILQGLLTSSPLAALLFFLWWSERKERLSAQAKYEKFLRENADRLLAFAEEQRTAMANHDKSIADLKRYADAANRR